MLWGKKTKKQNISSWLLIGLITSLLGVLLFPRSVLATVIGDWYPLDNGVTSGTDRTVFTLFRDDSTGDLYVGGIFDTVGGGTMHRIAIWDGTQWQDITGNDGLPLGTQTIWEIAIDPTSGNLYLVGRFTSVGGVGANGVAMWDGTQWHDLDGGIGSLAAGIGELEIDPDTGNVYVGGNIDHLGSQETHGVGMWDGTQWHDLSSGGENGVNGSVYGIISDPNNGNIYVGGDFTTAGGETMNHVAMWDGTQWHDLSSGGENGVNGRVIDFEFDSAGNLYAGGAFTTAGGQTANNIAMWDGTEWHNLADSEGHSGVNGQIESLEFDPSSGRLYTGGRFTTAGGEPVNYIAYWIPDPIIEPTATPTIINPKGPLPSTGFAPGQNIELPPQPVEKRFKKTSMILSIPKLDVRTSIVSVPYINDKWDISWLGNQVGHLEGTAYPTWEGNTVLTGHVWSVYNQPGIFIHLKDLQYGDEFSITSYGREYVYEVRENKQAEPNDESIFEHSDYDKVTLLTCEGFDESSGEYQHRRIIEAILIEVR